MPSKPTPAASAIWVLHLFGGARAIWGTDGEAHQVEVQPCVLSGRTLEFPATSIGDVIRKCHRLGIYVFGAAAISHKLEFDGIVPAEWRMVHYRPHKAWICHDAETCWSQIAFQAAKAKSGRLWDCAARISYQIEACVIRVQQLSEGYVTQLNSVLGRNGFNEGARMNDLWTQAIFLRIQSFFTDACILRDYLSEFAAVFIYKLDKGRRVSTLAGLLRNLRRIGCSDVLTQKLQRISQEGEWLAEIGAYRDLITHSAPLALARRQLWFWCKIIKMPCGEELPTVRFPLPENPADIMRARNKSDYANFEVLVAQFAGPAEISPSMKDALRYIHRVLGELASLALDLSQYSPVAPQMPVFTDKDLKGPVTWTSV
jgi:hypothetical protein